MDSVSLSTEERSALDGLAADLGRVFATRLRTVAAYGLHAPASPPRVIHTLALVQRLSFEDLAACVRTDSGDAVLQPCAEAELTSDGAEAIGSRGVIPLLSVRGEATVRIGRLLSMAEPQTRLAGSWDPTLNR